MILILVTFCSVLFSFQNEPQRVISDTTHIKQEKLEPKDEVATHDLEGDQATRSGNYKMLSEMRLTYEDVEKFLFKHHRDGPSLIAAFSLLGDLEYLKEAINEYPENPEVALVALSVGGEGPDALWISRLQAADPDNLLVQYLVSYEALLRQDVKEAFSALQRADTLLEFDDYNESRMKLIEEAAMDAGYSQELASAFAAQTTNPVEGLLPKYFEFANLISFHLADYRKQPEKVESIFQSALKLGDALQEEHPGRSVYIQVGAALFQKALYEAIVESKPFPSLEESPSAMANELLGYKQQLVEYSQAFNKTGWLSRSPESAVIEFFNVKRDKGELAALRWAMNHSE